jgi:hypothetical protein
MRLATRRSDERYLVDHSLRWLRPRNDSEYLFGNPETAARLNRAIEDSLTGRTHEFTMDELYARYGRERKA